MSVMPSLKSRRRNCVYLTLIVAGAQFSLMTLGLFSRLTFSIDTRYPLLQETLNNPIWAVLHGMCAFFIAVSLVTARGRVPALGAATGVLGAWSFLSFLWGLTTSTPVSLAGPLLGVGMSVLAYALCLHWAQISNWEKTPKMTNGDG